MQIDLVEEVLKEIETLEDKIENYQAIVECQKDLITTLSRKEKALMDELEIKDNLLKIKNGLTGEMKEKIKIITDGETAQIYVDGKKVHGKDIELHFSAHVSKRPMITVNAIWNKTDENGNLVLNEDKTGIMTEGIRINC